MNVLNENTQRILENLSRLSILTGYTFIGGTALALQLEHRISEDLDFCCWTNQPNVKRITINEESILQALNKTFQKVIIKYAADNQLDLLINNVKVTFFADNENKKPEGIYKPYLNNINLPDPVTIGAMKIGTMFSRIKFRDYYDLYAISLGGFSLQSIIESSLKFKPYLNPKLISIMLTSGNRIEDEDIAYLHPKYKITKNEIENYFKDRVREWSERI